MIRAFKIVIDYPAGEPGKPIGLSVYELKNGEPVLPVVLEGEAWNLGELKGMIAFACVGEL